MASQAELAAMRQAIVLSALGLGTTSPNPPVGCVILDTHGTLVGAGFHRRKGEPHAEVNALATAGTAARGGTAVVTLEPCNHIGVTPACRQELLDAGIARVVIGVIDPTSRGDGGAAVLASAGVDVETGVLHDEVLAVLGPWLTATYRRRPYVTWAHRSQQGLDHPAGDQHLATLRGAADVVVDGAAVSEGVPGGHSAAHFRLPDLDQSGGDLAPWLDDAYRSGARRVLLISSEPEPPTGYLPLIDELWLTLSRTNPAQASTPAGHRLLDAGFQIVDIVADQVTVTAHLRRAGSA